MQRKMTLCLANIFVSLLMGWSIEFIYQTPMGQNVLVRITNNASLQNLQALAVEG